MFGRSLPRYKDEQLLHGSQSTSPPIRFLHAIPFNICANTMGPSRTPTPPLLKIKLVVSTKFRASPQQEHEFL